jgi:hypothetical protein
MTLSLIFFLAFAFVAAIGSLGILIAYLYREARYPDAETRFPWEGEA